MHQCSLVSRITDRVGRHVHRHKISEPFLSGDLFANKADVKISKVYLRERHLLSTIHSARVIFCDGDYAQDFLENFGELLSNKVLLVGNSDKDWHEFPLHLAPKIRAVFLQNSFTPSDRTFTLPIGIENIAHYRNGRLRNFDRKFVLKPKQDQVLIGPFSPTHLVRRNMMLELRESSRVKFAIAEKLKPYEFAEFSSRFGYVASPRGNGEDTHRIWESLYRGCSPVVLQSAWTREIGRLRLPILSVEAWSNKCLEAIEPFQEFDPSKLEELWWPFWRQKISSLL